MTILIIDDSRFMQKAIDKTLRDAGYATILVGDGERGLSTAVQSLPDLILLDMMLPGLPGITVLQSLKKNPHTADIPIIVLTGLCFTGRTTPGCRGMGLMSVCRKPTWKCKAAPNF